MRRLYAAGLAMLLLLSVAACSEEQPRPKFADPTESPSDRESSGPPRANSPQDAVELWVSGFNELGETGDPEQVSAISDKNCRTCDRYIAPFVQLEEAGGQIQDGEWNIAQIEIQGDRQVVAVIDMAGGTSKVTKDADPVTFPPTRETIRFSIRMSSAGFVIRKIVTLAQ